MTEAPARQSALVGWIRRLISLFDKAIRLVLAILLVLGLALSFANVVMRFLLFDAIMWSEEVLAMWLVWCVSLGAYLVTVEGKHLSMEVVYQLLPNALRYGVDLFAAALVIGLSIFVVFKTSQLLMMMISFDQRTMASGLPVAIPYFAVALGFGLIALGTLLRLTARLFDAPGRTAEPDG